MSFCISLKAQNKDSIVKKVHEVQEELRAFYLDTTTTPLSKEERIEFKGIRHFPIDLNYRVKAKLYLLDLSDTVSFATSNGSVKYFLKYAEASFELESKKCKLYLYKRVFKNSNKEVNYLFLPFKDLTSGEETYGGGRYIDLGIPDSNQIIIDFNLCYQPYCAYSHNGWSCPIPPPENFLEVKVKAGVRD
ncbi:MAG: DUF1684 domain-containing protein [Bacteroidia bacterium]